ncbi:odorant receptor Or2-like isoform X2 [Cylas formicarius]|nr:odorant receptor Or2-like isoform X2 [Cylas formicarius]
MLNISLINVASAQLDILGETVSSFLFKRHPNFEEMEKVHLIKCAKKHVAVIRFVDQIEEVFTYICMTRCLSSIVSICNGVFQLTHTGNLYSVAFLFNIAFVFDVLFEIGIYCWFAGLLTIKSLAVADACYNYNWLLSSENNKKLLLIVLTRSQKPLFTTAGKFARLSMASFLSVLKTAYSYFALMQSLYERNEFEECL